MTYIFVVLCSLVKSKHEQIGLIMWGERKIMLLVTHLETTHQHYFSTLLLLSVEYSLQLGSLLYLIFLYLYIFFSAFFI